MLSGPAVESSTALSMLRSFLLSRNCEQALDADIVHTSGRASAHAAQTRSSASGLAAYTVRTKRSLVGRLMSDEWLLLRLKASSNLVESLK